MRVRRPQDTLQVNVLVAKTTRGLRKYVLIEWQILSCLEFWPYQRPRTEKWYESLDDSVFGSLNSSQVPESPYRSTTLAVMCI